MSENLTAFLNIFLAPLVGLIVILIDYNKRHPGDQIQRKIFSLLVCFSLAVILCDLVHIAVEGLPGNNFIVIHWAANFFFFFFKTVSFGLLVVFLRYTAIGSLAQMKKLTAAILIVNVVYAVVLVINLFTGRLFYVTHNNFYMHGEWFAVVVIAPYMLFLVCFIGVLIHRKSMNRDLFILLLVSALPVTIGSTLDLLFVNLRIMWPSFFISLLFCYLFIIRMTMLIDSLTNVYNRRGCDEYMISIAKSSRRKEYSIVMIDMDDFKSINDRFGHAQGDNALKETAAVLRSTVRRSDFVGRYGGDEFVIVAATNNADAIMENIRVKINKFNEKQIKPYTLALSCGGDIYRPDDPRTPLEFLSYVDSLMYSEKERRNN